MAGILNAIKRVVDPNERQVARLRRMARQVLELEDEIADLSDEELAEKTEQFRQRLQQGETLDDLLYEAFAVARETASRQIDEKPFEVQVMGAIAMHEGMVAEMKTGEGKTLTATMPLYLNALEGRGAHLVTTNDFLVRWQAEWMGQIFRALGLTVGHIQHNMKASERRAMYRRDITYITNSELGFDYLRDNMATSPEQLTQRELNYCIVDECDSILIDEARTPLIISGETSVEGANYDYIERVVSELIRKNDPDDPFYEVDKKDHAAALTEAGMIWIENELGMRDSSLVDPENLEIAQLAENALKAHMLYEKDHQYIVQDGEVVIVDEFTGHLQPGRRYSDGLHQAIEAKEHVYTPRERQTVASITYQNFFRLYNKLAGMTGTAKTEEGEFVSVYGMRVVAIPTNKPVAREDHPDVIHKTEEAKYRSITNEIIYCHVREQPVLVGTRSVEVSELVAGRLDGDRLRTHALTEILLWELADYNGIDDKTRKAWQAHLRRPVPELVGQAQHLRRRSDGDDVHLGDIVAELDIDPDILADENIERMLQITDLAADAEDDETYERYFSRLRQMLNNGMQPGDEDELSDLNILNAKRHEAEGQIIAEAGRPGMVTVATNMAGRGVNIVLGGHNPDPDASHIPEKYEKVKRLGGLHVIGTERHESRRIDNQLRGRSGRQGDPGSSRFHVSLQDELMQLFGPDRFGMFLDAWPEEEPVAHGMITKSLERAQRKVEMRNQGIRKNTLKYDNVMNKQRSVIYEQRRRVLNGENVHPAIERMIERTVTGVIEQYAPEGIPEDQWDLETLYERLRHTVGSPPDTEERSRDDEALNGLALRLAEADLKDVAARGLDLHEYLVETAETYPELDRSMDPERAKRIRRENVEKTIRNMVDEFAPEDAPEESWRLMDLARAVGHQYEGALDDLGYNGLLNIPPPELSETLIQTVLGAYQDRERALIDTRIVQGVRRWCPARTDTEQWNIPALEAFLFGWLHDLRPRLAIDRLEAMVVDEPAQRWLQEHITAAAEDESIASKAGFEREGFSKGEPGSLQDPDEFDDEKLSDRIASLAAEYGESEQQLADWDTAGLVYALLEDYPRFVASLADDQLEAMVPGDGNLIRVLCDYVRQEPAEGAGETGYRLFRYWERSWLMNAVDKSWMEHLLAIDQIRDGIHLRGHAQRDPLVEYQREASQAFEQLLDIIARRTTQFAFSKTESIEDAGAQIRQMQARQEAIMQTDQQGQQQQQPAGAQQPASAANGGQPPGTFVAEDEPGRNDPCPCGSGKKYKQCCGRK